MPFGSTGAFRGLINLRGQIVMALDLRRRFEIGRSPSDSELPMNVVVRTDDGAVSLLVDEIGDVLEVDEGSFEHPPETHAGKGRELVLVFISCRNACCWCSIRRGRLAAKLKCSSKKLNKPRRSFGDREPRRICRRHCRYKEQKQWQQGAD